MHELHMLKTLHPIWLHRVVQSMAKGATVREDLRGQLEQFYCLLEQAVETGDPAWLDPIISSWAESLTQSDLEGDTSNLTEFLNELIQLTFNICRETLDEIQALEVIGIILPAFTFAYQKAAKYEIMAHSGYIANQLKETQQALERLDKSKSDFITVAAHELKTPLTLIEGYASMLCETHEKVNPKSSEMQLLNGVRNGTIRLRSIVDDMIDVSMIDNNLLLLNFQPVWLNRLFTLLQNEVEDSINDRRQVLHIEPFPGSNELTFADPERLLQVFRNILMNAIKYTPDCGHIYIDGRKLPGFIEVTITDSGIGIDPEDQTIIFEKFSRLGNTSLHSSGKTKFKGGGPGLGLHIAKGIVESHGGAIWAESPGYDEKNLPGSIFHVLLPIRSVPPDDKMAKLFEPLTQNKSFTGRVEPE
jgi:signal transduction histidine kinase